jgi:alanine dehydrogenase
VSLGLPPGSILVVDRATVCSVLSMSDCIEVMEDALGRLAAGQAQVPVRESLRTLAGRGVLALMPAELAPSTGRGVLGYKAVTVFPGNRPLGQPSHQAAIALHDAETGRMTALVEGTEITELRTAAVSAVATRHLARPNASVLAIMGAGAQARSHLRAIPHVRAIRRAVIWSRRREEAQRLAAEEASAAGFPIDVAETPEEAARSADVIVTATSARDPFLAVRAVAAGAHINAVGSCFPDTREVTGDLVAAAAAFVDDRAAAMEEAGDLLLAMADGLIGEDHVRATLGEVLIGSHRGRTSAEEITLFESLGLGVEDVATAAFVVERAMARGLGKVVDL